MNTLEGGRAVVLTMTEKLGSYEAYQKHMGKIASKGGSKTMAQGAKPKGFAWGKSLPIDDPRHPANCGRRGGTISRRGNGTKKYQLNTKGYFERVEA